MDQERGRLPAALVAAGRFARAHRRNQPSREGEAFIGDIGFGGFVQDLRAREHVAGERKAVARKMSAPVDALLPGEGRDAACCIQDVELPGLATWVSPGERADDV